MMSPFTRYPNLPTMASAKINSRNSSRRSLGEAGFLFFLLLSVLVAKPTLAAVDTNAPAAAPPATAAEDQASSLSLDSFRRIPVLERGRKMPMDSYARLKLLAFSGKSTVNGESATAWLARLFFTPETTVSNRVFLINHPEIAEALAIPVAERRRYTFAEIEPSLFTLSELAKRAARVEGKERSVVEAELIRVYENLDLYLQLRDAFRFIFPIPNVSVDADTMEALGMSRDTPYVSFLDIYNHIGKVEEVVAPLETKDQADWTPIERAVFDLSSATFHQVQHMRSATPALLPVTGHGSEIWLSAWDAIPFLRTSSSVREDLQHVVDLAAAYYDGRQLEFDSATRALRRSVEGRAEQDTELRHLDLEVFYNQLQPFYRAELLYGLAFLFGFAAMLSHRKTPAVLTLLLVVAGLAPHSAGILMRMQIMGRPPMTNLYATFLFVAWVCVVLCLVLEWFQRNRTGLLTAAFSGLALLLLAGRFGTEGDSMGKVVAVLDSNFWLATHVVCITMGYAGCCVAGVLGHIYILQALLAPRRQAQRASTFRAMIAVLGFGLTFSFFGTMLGGVWADQSWGRFWGWDPKENGALLIVLWCAILFHARTAKLIGETGMAAGCVLGMIVTAFAWLGVNLLNVGLHSYGFTSGLAFSLGAYAILQVLFLVVTVPFAVKRIAAVNAPM